MKIRRSIVRTLCLWGLWLGVGLQVHAQTDTVTYVYTDPQGTPLVKADASGNVIAKYDYTPYGNSITSLGTAPNGPGYTGQVDDQETGLVYMQARYYQPTGRFLSPDPVGSAAGNVYSFNQYAYANNNPIVYDDPTGMFPGDSDDFEHSAYPVQVTFFGAGDEGGGGDSTNSSSQSTNSSSTTSGATSTSGASSTTSATSQMAVALSDTSDIDKDAIVHYIDRHAGGRSQGKCAAYCRRAFEVGGVDTKGHPVDAKDYGPLLLWNDASVVPQSGYKPERGDVVVFKGSAAHPSGHIAIYDGKQWVSDFKQNHMSPYGAGAPPATIYRFPGN